jgi:Pentapeptide repeats (8 copies)
MTANFQNANLQGRSFKGQDLTAVDFSGADIRGANFTHAVLTGANLSRVKAGLTPFQAILMGGIILLLFVLSGFITGYAAGVISSLLMPRSIASQNELTDVHHYTPLSSVFSSRSPSAKDWHLQVRSP